MKLKVTELVPRQSKVINSCEVYGLDYDLLIKYACAMAKTKDNHKECFDYCDRFFVWAQSYADIRRKVLNIEDVKQLVEDEGDNEFIAKCIMYGTILDDKEIPAAMKKFINYCQTHYSLFDKKEQQRFSKDFCKAMQLKLDDNDPKYWEKMVAKINDYEKGNYPEPRRRVSSFISSMVHNVHNAVESIEDSFLENDPEKYTAHYLKMMLPESEEFYPGTTDLEVANSFAKRHKAAISFPIGTDYPAVLVKQLDHFLICERNGKVLWDQKCTSGEASAEYNEAYDMAAKQWNSVWLSSHSTPCEKLHLNLPKLDWDEEEEEEVSEQEEVTEEVPFTCSVANDGDFWLVLGPDGTIVEIWDDMEDAEKSIETIEPITKEKLIEQLGTSNSDDIENICRLAENWISSNPLKYPMPSDPYQRAWACLLVL